jgi:dGTPase
MVHTLAVDLIAETRQRVAVAAPRVLGDVRNSPAMAGFSDAVRRQQNELKAFLRDNLYRHHQVLRMTNKARRIIADLFGAFFESPELLPPQYQHMARVEAGEASPVAVRARAVADYIAGMTDRYAIKEHRRLFAVGEI